MLLPGMAAEANSRETSVHQIKKTETDDGGVFLPAYLPVERLTLEACRAQGTDGARFDRLKGGCGQDLALFAVANTIHVKTSI